MWYQWIKFVSSRAPPFCQPNFGDGEPLLADVLADPDIHRLMACDGVEMKTLLSLIDCAQRRIQ